MTIWCTNILLDMINNSTYRFKLYIASYSRGVARNSLIGEADLTMVMYHEMILYSSLSDYCDDSIMVLALLGYLEPPLDGFLLMYAVHINCYDFFSF